VSLAPGVVERAAWGTLHQLLRRNPKKYLPGIVAYLTTLEGDAAVRRLGSDVDKSPSSCWRAGPVDGFLLISVHQPMSAAMSLSLC
jgi:hypothetical protein